MRASYWLCIPAVLLLYNFFFLALSSAVFADIVHQLRVIYGLEALAWPKDDPAERFVKTEHALATWQYSRAAMRV